MSSVLAPQQEVDEEPKSTTFCPYCNIHLAFPSSAGLILCPSCHNTLDPNAAHQVRCSGCSCLLAFPPNSLYIQCPRCFHTMDPRGVAAVPPSSTAPPPPIHHQQHKVAVDHSSSAATEPKKRRDPNAPKAVCNAYMVFCRTRRNEIKDEYPELPFGKIGAKLGEIWRNMTPEQKKPYDDRAAVDRERYRKEMLQYQHGSKGGDQKRQKNSSSDDKQRKTAKNANHDDDEEGEEEDFSGDGAEEEEEEA